MTVEQKVERYRELSYGWYIFMVMVTAVVIAYSIHEIFLLRFWILTQFTYYYLIIGLLLGCSFILIPPTKNSNRHKVPWYDVMLCFLTWVCFGFLFINAEKISLQGWAINAPQAATIISIVIWIIALESLRRTGGSVLFFVSLFFSLYGLIAGYMPGFLRGLDWDLFALANYHVMSSESLIGIPARMVCNIMIGFIIFGVTLQATGGGEFFMDFAYGLMGSVRGGPAKVSVISSGLTGMISGSVVTNVITTGTITIPAMKKTGYPPFFAAAIEAVASTGGCIMPPVMGTVAFIMASFLEMPYYQIVLAAIIPALLYYFMLFVQIDAFAAKKGLKGISKSEIASLNLKNILKQGWFYIASLVILTFMLFYIHQEAQAPYYASLFLIIGSMLNKKTRFTFKSFLKYIGDCGKTLTEMMGLLVGIGLVVGGLTITGVAVAFSSEMTGLVGGNAFLLLVISAFASFILGMGLNISACYIFLVFMIVPILIPLSFDPVAVHLFVIYCGLLSFLTPPVATGAYVAANIAGANPIKTGFYSIRLGIGLFLIPFFFIYDPAILLRGDYLVIIQSVITIFLGCYLIASSIEGYMLRIGILGLDSRIALLIGGVLLSLKGLKYDLLGLGFFASVILINFMRQKTDNKDKDLQESI